jgi:predicted PurR-regulated permease PerM
MNSTTRGILIAAGILLAAALIWYVRVVLSYVVISAVLSIVGRPVMQWIERRRIGRRGVPASGAAFITLIFLLLVFLGFVGLFVPLVVQEANTINNIDTEKVKQAWAEPIADLEHWVDDKGLVPEGQDKGDFINEKINRLVQLVSFSDVFYSIVSQLGNFLMMLFSVLFITFFLLRDRNILIRWIYMMTPEDKYSKMGEVLKQARKTLRRYFLGILLQITLMTALISIGLSILGIKGAILIGFLAGLINIIPYLGPLIGGFIGLLVGISSHLELDFYSEILPLSLKILAVFSTAQLLDNFIFQPFIFSNSVKAHPLEIFLVILVAGTLAGIPGMILAVPVYSLFRIIADAFFSQFKIVRSFTRTMKLD